MCGIVGHISFNGRAKSFGIDKAVEALAHRGPDDRGKYVDEWAALGHTRLSIIDIDGGHQPVFNEDGKITLIYNGEIYNHAELRTDLTRRGHTFRSRCDSEVIVHAYEEFGIEKALTRLNGMFAFAIWDIKKKILILARDRVGIKPLYYSLGKTFFTFSSEIKSMLASGMISKKMREDCFFEYFATNGIFGEETIFEDVTELKPAHYLICKSDGTVATTRYWDMVSIFKETSLMRNEEDAVNRLGEELQKSVNYRLISDAPLGVLLSGGIDSSLVAHYVANSSQVNARDIKFFNAKNINKDIDESAYAMMQVDFLQQSLGRKINFESILLDTGRFLKDFRHLSYIYDEPIQFQSSGFIYHICSQARREGIKALLVGEGSDELFFGYERFNRTLRNIDSGKYKGYSDNEIIYFGGGLDNLALVERLTGVRRESREDIESFRWLNEHQDLDISERMVFHSISYRLQSVLMRMDRMSMASGVEVRVPFLDHHIIEFANSVVSAVKSKNNEPKYIVKKLSKGRVHYKIIAREKMGSPSDIGHWLDQAAGEGFMKELVESSGSISRSYLDYGVVKEIMDLHYRKQRKHSALIWMLFSMEMWNRMLHNAEPIEINVNKRGVGIVI